MREKNVSFLMRSPFGIANFNLESMPPARARGAPGEIALLRRLLAARRRPGRRIHRAQRLERQARSRSRVARGVEQIAVRLLEKAALLLAADHEVGDLRGARDG